MDRNSHGEGAPSVHWLILQMSISNLHHTGRLDQEFPILYIADANSPPQAAPLCTIALDQPYSAHQFMAEKSWKPFSYGVSTCHQDLWGHPPRLCSSLLFGFTCEALAPAQRRWIEASLKERWPIP